METLDQRLHELAKSEDNVVARGELLDLGFTDQMIETCVARLRWQQLHAGVYLLGAALPTWQQRCRGALKAAGADAQLAGETGLALLEVDGAVEGRIHILVPYKNCPRVNGVAVHRTTVADKGRRGAPMITSSVERLLIDFAASASAPRLECAVESALTKGLTSEQRLWRAVAALAFRMPGVARLTRVLEERPRGKAARSTLEIALLRVIKRGDLPIPIRNFDVYVDGKHYEVDLAYPDCFGAIEADSRRFHATATQKRRDKERQEHLEAIGYRFKRFSWGDVFGRPEWVVEQVRELLACAEIRAEPGKLRKRGA